MPDRIAHWTSSGYVLGDIIPDVAPASGLSPLFVLALVAGLIIIVGLPMIFYMMRRLRVVHGQEALVIERFGAPQPRVRRQGLNFIMPFSSVRHTIDLKQQQIETSSAVKTADDAFIEIDWVLRYSVIPTDEAILAFVYKVAKPVEQMVWRVENELRQIISEMTLAEIYSQKDRVATKILDDQATNALESGLQIDGVVIEQPSPPDEVQDAMNAKLAAVARQQAAVAEAEAERLRRVGIATAESQSKKLQGEGIAAQRMAIAKGFRESVELLRAGMPDASMSDVTNLIMQANQADMVTTAAAGGKATLIFVPMNMGVTTAGQIASLAEGASIGLGRS